MKKRIPEASLFDVTPSEAITIQKELRHHIDISKPVHAIRTIAGADISFNRFGKYAYAGIVVLTYPDLQVIETSCVQDEMKFPYVPGLLSFREIPSLLKAWEKLATKPDVVVVDGHGIAHPRRLGIATHFSFATGTPTIGSAKSVLFGSYAPLDLQAGATSYLHDTKTNEVIGTVLRSKKNVKPIFVSPGNGITLEQSVEIIKSTVKGYRLPELTRLAHNLVNEFRRKHKEE